MSTDLGETEEGIVFAVAHVSDKKDVPEINTSEYCLSCGARTEQKFCGECGLKNDDLRRSLFRLIAESLGGIFSFESRMWRTWGALFFKPGKVAREYANGARSRYSSPIRVYLVVSFLFFAFLAISQTNLIAIAVMPAADKPAIEAQNASEQPATADPQPTPNEINQTNKEAVQAIIEAAKKDDDVGVEEAVEKIQVPVAISDYNFEVLFFQPQSKFDALMNENSTEKFLEALETNDDGSVSTEDGNTLTLARGSFDAQKAITTFIKNPSRFNQQFNTWLPRVMFFMVPMVMFLGVIYIRGPNALLYDHLIHAIYIHSMLFLAVLLAIITSRIVSGALVAQVLAVGFLIYLPLSLKRMFGRGWFKTVWTTLNIGFIYSLLLIFAILGISVKAMSELAV
jgi:hypothetical protein